MLSRVWTKLFWLFYFIFDCIYSTCCRSEPKWLSFFCRTISLSDVNQVLYNWQNAKFNFLIFSFSSNICYFILTLFELLKLLLIFVLVITITTLQVKLQCKIYAYSNGMNIWHFKCKMTLSNIFIIFNILILSYYYVLIIINNFIHDNND